MTSVPLLSTEISASQDGVTDVLLLCVLLSVTPLRFVTVTSAVLISTNVIGVVLADVEAVLTYYQV